MSIDKGVTYAKGFTAQGVEAGIKKLDTKDVAVIYSEVPCKSAAVYTTNKVQAACIQVNKKHLENGMAQAVVVNSGNANACTGEQGLRDTYKMAEAVAAKLNIDKHNVLIASTGVIGVYMPMDRVEAGIAAACSSLTADGGHNACRAIMTTDTVPKEAGVEIMIGGKAVHIGGMAKGSGMIHPNMATMLGFITTDANISIECLDKALKDSTAITYNMISVDGDTSTNDMVIALANGLADNNMIDDSNSAEYKVFKQALDEVNMILAKAIARDGEGATRLVEVSVEGAPNDIEARKIARSVTSSSLFKAAVYGEDANWGRIICAAGYSGADFDPNRVDIYLGSQQMAANGMGIAFNEDVARKDLGEEVVKVKLDLKQGAGQATAWGCDLSYDYVKINASYRS
ncbi:MAG: bifunctional glutamate N-acetyltransferase/amino-acid acetyltransferase ArgJ [Deltaproteobacteria bacterium]